MIRSTRREFLKVGGLVLAGPGAFSQHPAVARFLRVIRTPGAPAVIEMRSDVAGSRVWFDPIGLFVEPGTTVRWVVRESVHTTTAYHPENDHHPLRIPETAAAWNSGFLLNPGDHFDVTLTVAGVYDYYCMPHEAAGMVGRIVVGQAGGPGAEPFNYWVGRPGTRYWRQVPASAQQAFPGIAQIIAERRVHRAPPGN